MISTDLAIGSSVSVVIPATVKRGYQTLRPAWHRRDASMIEFSNEMRCVPGAAVRGSSHA